MGRYELGVPAGQAVLGDLLPVAGTVRTIQVGPGGCVQDVDFGWKAPPAAVVARVFGEPAGSVDGAFDAGRDAWLPGVTVTLGASERVTDADGFARFPAVAAGTVTVAVNAYQPALARYTPSTPSSVVLVVDGCAEREVRFGFGRVCETTCCEGDLREVVVGTSFWVGNNVKLYDIVARLEVERGATYVEVDSAARAWRTTFGAPLAGANEVLEVLEVQVQDGVACVVVRLRARGALFPDGVFGTDRYKLRVSLNGESHYGCGVLRCESFRPGMYFSLPADGSGVPACDSGWAWDGTCNWQMPWLSSRNKECPRYIVLDTTSQAEWECQNVALASPLTASR
ncbi:MAG: carboxypeptidase-like regulatory domain-containing protein [Planctomycetia bacterium]